MEPGWHQNRTKKRHQKHDFDVSGPRGPKRVHTHTQECAKAHKGSLWGSILVFFLEILKILKKSDYYLLILIILPINDTLIFQLLLLLLIIP